jgi:hypothetical protein
LTYTINPANAATTAGNLVIGAATFSPYTTTSQYASIGVSPYATAISGAVTVAATIAPSGMVRLTGADADIVINGVSLSATLAAIESRLAILRTSKELEAEWDDLKQLGDAYRKLEQEIKEKMKAWDALKNTAR